MNYHVIKNELDLDVIWRYMDISKFSLLICQRKLWFSRADLLGDEHEGSYPECMINSYQVDFPKKEDQEKIRRGSKKGREHTYVSCWTKKDPESFAMWKIYTPQATGIAIQSSSCKLANKCFIKRPNDLIDRLGLSILPIKYDLDCIEKVDDEDNFNRYEHKLKAYQYEKEIRILFTFIPTVEKPKIGQELEVDLDNLIDKIYISHRLGDGLEEFVKDILQEHGLDKEIVKPSFVRIPKF